MQNTKKILILGGGTAGWMAANLMAKKWHDQPVSICLLEFEDIGIKVASSIVQFFHDPNQLKIIESLIQLGLNVEQTNQQPTDGTLTGLNFLFTGTLIQLKRSDAEAMVEAKGGHILSGVSSKLNYLIVGEDAGSKLEKAKKIASIKIITEAEFIDLVK